MNDDQLHLFGGGGGGDPPEARYPLVPGAKAGDTSQEAADSMGGGYAETLRARAMDAIHRFGPMTADEIADKLGVTVLAARPRCTELLRLGRIAYSGEKRKNVSGRNARVWKAAA